MSAPSIKRDYSSVKGVYDLSSEIINPWCFRGGRDCPCQDPLVAVQGDAQNWDEVFSANMAVTKSERARFVDVVFYGDSITEGWRGKHFGEPNIKSEGNLAVYDSLFSTENGGSFEGIALGIAGDRSPNLLWRLQNGELPGNLYPSIFWVLIGTNDIGNTWCSPEIVVVGILRIVEEILSRKIAAQVVINGLLPRSFHKEGYVARGGQFKPSIWQDIKAINDELKLYATYRERVVYFETDVFFKDPKATTAELQIDEDLMPDFLHPSAKGYRLWGEGIVEKLREIIPRN